MLNQAAIRRDSLSALKRSWLPALLIVALYVLILTLADLLAGGWQTLKNQAESLELLASGENLLALESLQRENNALNYMRQFLVSALTVLFSPYVIYSFQALYRPNMTLDLMKTPSDSGWAKPGHSPAMRMNFKYGWRVFAETGSGRILTLMIFRQLSLLLWALLIIPYFIKRYAYVLAPYILRDNPDLPPSLALRASNIWTFGHKIELFLTDLLFNLPLFAAGGIGIALATQMIAAGRSYATVALVYTLLVALVSIFTRTALNSYHALFYEAVRASHQEIKADLSQR